MFYSMVTRRADWRLNSNWRIDRIHKIICRRIEEPSYTINWIRPVFYCVFFSCWNLAVVLPSNEQKTQIKSTSICIFHSFVFILFIPFLAVGFLSFHFFCYLLKFNKILYFSGSTSFVVSFFFLFSSRHSGKEPSYYSSNSNDQTSFGMYHVEQTQCDELGEYERGAVVSWWIQYNRATDPMS